jgi:predicted lipid-binding transport protein (Tim44 family)
MQRLYWLIIPLFILLFPILAHARAGGGCLVEGTLIKTPNGSVAIEKLKEGDTIIGLVAGRLQAVTVQALIVVHPDEYLEITADGNKVAVTEEHPLMTASGEFRQALFLAAGQTIYRAKAGKLIPVRISSVKKIPAWSPAFNLMVIPGGTFIAGGFIVHNKGCFLPDTPVLLHDGTETPISTVQPGDRVMAFTGTGTLTTTTVNKVITREVKRYVQLETSRGTLLVTVDHPFYLGRGQFRTLESLRVGERIMARQGTGLAEVAIVAIRPIGKTVKVYNLQTDTPNTFFAGGLAVHNKGGGGGGGSFHSSHSGSGSYSGGGFSKSPSVVIPGLIIMAIIFFVAIRVNKSHGPDKEENLDYVFDRPHVERKSRKTEKLLEFLGRQDPTMLPGELRSLAEAIFRKLQECWSARDYLPLEPLLMPDLHARHSAQLRSLARNHEVNIIENLTIEAVDLVNVRYTEKPDQREFTALITAQARDYYIDDRSRNFLRGDTSLVRFQEFLTFQWSDGTWLLRDIEQTGESDILKDENFIEMLTDETVQRIYAEAAANGTAGPWLEQNEEAKASRTERLLNFLAQTDRLWNRRTMLEKARQTFLDVYLARESGDPESIPADILFPDVAGDLRAQLQQLQTDGVTIEYRNLCIRKAEIILVRNFIIPAKDEYTVRIDVHAQRIVRKGGKLWREDRYVTPFEEYWTFGRLDNDWKLKEVLPPARGKGKTSEENVDEDSGPGQLEWYYRQPRAR